MNSKQNEVLTAIKVLIENKMYREATELINSSMIQESLERSKLPPVVPGGGSGNWCIVCGDNKGHGGLPCPNFTSLSR
jgi:hypothetical protein